MSQLLPDGTLRRRVFEWCDEKLCKLIFGTNKTISEECGNRMESGHAGIGCKCTCKALDILEENHCLKNAHRSEHER